MRKLDEVERALVYKILSHVTKDCVYVEEVELYLKDILKNGIPLEDKNNS